MTSAAAAPRSSAATMPLAAAGALLVALTAAGPCLHLRFGIYAFWAIVIASSLAAAWAALAREHLEPRQALIVILAVATAARLVLLLGEPLLSTDIYRYVWDGRVQAAGINPYRHVPAAPELAALRAGDTTIYPFINRADYAPTIYPPAAQMLFLVATRLGESVAAMKLALLALEAVAIAAMIIILQRTGQPATRVAAYAWHPLPLWEIAGNGHVDAAMLALMLLAVWCFLDGKVLRAGILAMVAALIKPAALLLMPVLWRPWGWRLPATLIGVTALLYLPYLGVGWQVLGFLPGYLAEEGLVAGSGFRYLGMLERLTGVLAHGGAIYAGVAGAVLVWLALRVSFRADRSATASVQALGLLIATFLILLTPHYPWYHLAIAPFLVLTPRALTPWVLTVGGFVLYDAVPNATLPSFELRDGLLRVGALAAFAHDLLRGALVPPQPPTGDHRK